MSYKCGNIISTWKLSEQVAFVMQNKMLVGILERSLHTLITNTAFGTKFGKYPSRTDGNHCCYYKSNRWITKNEFVGENPLYNEYRQSRRNTLRFRNDGLPNKSFEHNWHRQSRNNRFKFGNNNFWSRNQDGERQMFGNRSNGQSLEEPKWNSENLPPFVKNYYVPHSDVTSRNPSEVEAYRKANRITVSGTVALSPIQRFEETNFPNYIQKVLKTNGFEKPTPIQAQTWPIVMSGHNLIGIAQTGSGKTIAYIVPAILHINQQVCKDVQSGPTALILVPTRELAQQIERVAIDFGITSNCNSVCLFGGQSRNSQIKKLAMNPKICIATPGRLLDFLINKQISLKQCTYLVLDEADRMLDMGFEPQIMQIIEQIRPDRQIVMWSASWPRRIVPLARKYIKDPVHITIGALYGGANRDIIQIVDVCTQDEKLERLERLLATIYEEETDDAKILIFVSTQIRVNIVAYKIRSAGYHVLDIHGGKTQTSRDRTIDDFRSGRKKILVATDVVSRGLDVPDIDYVINLDYAINSEQYIHRIGRTARFGRKGKSYTFFTREDRSLAPDLIDVLREADQEVNPELVKLNMKLRPTLKT